MTAPAQPSPPTVLVLAGGGPAHPALALPPADLVVAADSGALLAPALGVAVDVLVGDLDSLAPAAVAALEAGGTRVARHHRDKDATDIELALAVAAAEDPARVVLVGGHGGRLDHSLATLAALSTLAAPGRRVEAWMGEAQVVVTVDAAALDGRPGELVSLLPIGGPARGVTTRGLRWPLDRATLDHGTTWGMSNEVVDAPFGVAVDGGTLVVVRPHALAPEADARPVPPRPGATP